MSESSMCERSQFMAASASAFLTARAARLHALSEKPALRSCSTMAASGIGPAGACRTFVSLNQAQMDAPT